MTAGVKASLKRLVEELKVSGRKDLAKIIDPGNVKQGGASLLLRNLATALETAPNDQVLTRGSLEIAEALNADASNLRGHQYLRLGNEVMLEASDFRRVAGRARSKLSLEDFDREVSMPEGTPCQ